MLHFSRDHINPVTESPQYLQCRSRHTDVLRLLHQHHHHHFCCSLSGVQGHCRANRYGRPGVPYHLFWCRSSPAFQVSQGCSRCCGVQGRPRPDPHHCRAGAARDGAQGRRHPRCRRTRKTLLDHETKDGGGGVQEAARGEEVGSHAPCPRRRFGARVRMGWSAKTAHNV